MFLFVYHISPFIWHQITKLFVLLYEQIPNHTLEEIEKASDPVSDSNNKDTPELLFSQQPDAKRT